MMIRRAAVFLAACLSLARAEADPIGGDFVKGLENCFNIARTASAACDRFANDTAGRLACLQDARTAQQDCLERVRAAIERQSRPPAPAPETPQPSVSTQAPATPAPSDADRTSATDAGRPPAAPVAPPQRDNNVPREAHGAPSPSPATPAARVPPAAPASRWIVSEMASPIDYSPILSAELRALSSSSSQAPTELVLRCRNGRTELAVRTERIWRPARTGDVEFTLTVDGKVEARSRWLLAPDGKTASSRDDAAALVRALPARKISVAISDETGGGGAAEFDLAGVDAVKTKLAEICHWAHSDAEPRRR